MLLDARCEVMLSNSMQCPNQVVPDGKVCLLHEQMSAGLNVDETNVNTNTLPEQNKPNEPEA